MKRLALLVGLLAALTVPAAALAHPLGNFTVNRYSAVEASGDRVYVKYVLDLAEIPAYQEGDRVRRTGFAREIARGLELELDGRPAVLRVLTSRVNSRPGAGGLATLRFEAVFEADRTGSALRFRDTNYADRIGWRELVVRGERGARIVSSNVPATSISDELRAYPEDLLSEPLDVSVAEAELRPGSLPGRAPELGDAAAPAPRQARKRRLRRPDRAGRPRPRRHPRLARARLLLGRRSRALAGPRQGHRHGLSRRDSAGPRGTQRRSG